MERGREGERDWKREREGAREREWEREREEVGEGRRGRAFGASDQRRNRSFLSTASERGIGRRGARNGAVSRGRWSECRERNWARFGVLKCVSYEHVLGDASRGILDPKHEQNREVSHRNAGDFEGVSDGPRAPKRGMFRLVPLEVRSSKSKLVFDGFVVV